MTFKGHSRSSVDDGLMSALDFLVQFHSNCVIHIQILVEDREMYIPLDFTASL